MHQKIKATAAAVALAFTSSAFAAGHYVTGVEGIDSAAVPPPGLYYLGYLVNYDIGSVDGAPGNNTANITALANRGVWVTHQTFLGANYGVETIIPLQSTSLNFNGIGLSSASRGVGDIYVGPVVLGWHGDGWHAVFALGEWFDTGSYTATNPSSIGNGYNSTMATLGGMVNLDAQKRWSASILARFEKNGVQKQTGITPGDGLSVEWGIARAFGAGYKVGLVGYTQNQTSSNTGPGANPRNPRKNGAGLEVDIPFAEHGFFMKIAGYHEYGASGGATEGNLLRMTFVKAF